MTGCLSRTSDSLLQLTTPALEPSGIVGFTVITPLFGGTGAEFQLLVLFGRGQETVAGEVIQSFVTSMSFFRSIGWGSLGVSG